MKQVKLGIVGFGFMGHCDADMIDTFPDEQIRLAAVADTDPEQMKDAPAGVETYSSIDEMLEKADINVVMISTPNPSHLEMVEKCAKAGKRAWFIGGNKGSAIIEGWECEGKIVRTAHLLENVPGKITMTAAGPTRSFGPAAPGLLLEEPLPDVRVEHRNYFEHFIRAFNGEEEIVIQPAQVRRVLKVMEAVRESAKTGRAIAFEA